jgi:hypothetical protein
MLDHLFSHQEPQDPYGAYIRLAQPHLAAMLHVATALIGPADAEGAA